MSARSPTKAVRTRLDNDKELVHLLRVFGHMPIDAILPGASASTWTFAARLPRYVRTAKALFSHIFNKAREWGYSGTEPMPRVRGFKESGRSRYVTDDEFAQVKAHATDRDRRDGPGATHRPATG